jgi:AbrB family looped-hinge helix DNA binding protein
MSKFMLFCISEIQKGGSMLINVKKRYTVTIPKSIREKLSVKEGEYIEAEVKGHSLVLTPVKVIKKDQEYFWTKEWQAGESEAEEDIKAGRLSRAFAEDAFDLFMKDLHKEAKQLASKKN